MFWNIPVRSTAATVLIAAIGASAAADDHTVIADIEAKLNASSFSEREAISRDLLDSLSVSDEDLLQLCMTTTSPEVRRRALAIHRSRFFTSPRPAIGVTFIPDGGLPMIERVHDGFPAERDGVLRAGDIIVAVAGIPLNAMPSLARQELRSLTFSHSPYETMRLKVFRPQNPEARGRFVAEIGALNPDLMLRDCPEGFDEIEVDVQLGEYSMLDTDALTTMDRTRAWHALLARHRFDPSEPEMAVRDESQSRNNKLFGQVVPGLDIRFPFLARAAFFPNDENPAGYRNQAVIARQLRNVAIQQVRINPAAMPGANAPGRDIVVETVRTTDGAKTDPADLEVQRTAREIASLQSRILELSSIATEPGTPAAERRIAQDTIDELRDRLSELRDGLKTDQVK